MVLQLHALLVPGVVTNGSGGSAPPSPGISFATLAAVMAIALIAPLVVNLRPSLRIPSAVAEIVLGILVGPSGFGWIHVDRPLAILSTLGLALLLFLAGLEIDARRLRHGVGRIGVAYLISVGLAVLVALAISQVEHIESPLFVAFALASSTVGLIVPILRDAKQTETRFGQLALAGASVGEFGAILLLSLFFSGHASSTGSRLVLLGLFGVLVVTAAIALSGLSRSTRAAATLAHLERTSAQLGVRLAMAVLVGFAALATALGLETILGVFIAGLVLRMVDREEHLIHSVFRLKIEAIGYGFLVPVFFVASGMELNFRALFLHPRHLLLVPAFVIALLIVRGLPAAVYRDELGRRRATALGLLRATSLTVPVIAASLGHNLHIFDDATASALVVAGVLSVVLFPPTALTLLRRDQEGVATLAGDGEQLFDGALDPVGKQVQVVNRIAVRTETKEQGPGS
ncbi:MAG TPA: cation:proton antiporter [Solirubrobacteraceae bacterium]